ncbi:MAG: AAA family ATPase [Elusimicrobia bacterium]|nr:AAA family ATPase [Elusimicrobiota bacterium]
MLGLALVLLLPGSLRAQAPVRESTPSPKAALLAAGGLEAQPRAGQPLVPAVTPTSLLFQIHGGERVPGASLGARDKAEGSGGRVPASESFAVERGQSPSASYGAGADTADRDSGISRVKELLAQAGADGGAAGSPAAYQAVAALLPAGSALQRDVLALAAASGAGARRYELDRAWEDVAQPYGTEDLLPKAELPEDGSAPRLAALDRLRVPADRVRWSPPQASLPTSTAEVSPSSDADAVAGQRGAIASLRRGLMIDRPDAHVMVTGHHTPMQLETALREAGAAAAKLPTPLSLVQVRGFDAQGAPGFLWLKPGTERSFVAAGQAALQAMSEELPGRLAALRQAETFKKLIDPLLLELKPRIDSLRQEAEAIHIQDDFRLSLRLVAQPERMYIGFELRQKITGQPMGEKLAEYLDKREKPYSVEDVGLEVQEKGAVLLPKINELAEILRRFYQKFQEVAGQQQLAAVGQLLQPHLEQMLRIAEQVDQGLVPHDDSRHQAIGEKREASTQELRQSTEAKLRAWKLEVESVNLQGFGLAFSQQRMDIPGLSAKVPVEVLAVTYAGKPIRSPEGIEALRKEGILQQFMEGLQDGAAAPEDGSEAAGAPSLEQRALAAVEGWTHGKAKGVLAGREQILREAKQVEGDIQARWEAEHAKIHEKDLRYQTQRWVGRFAEQLQQNFGAFLGGQGAQAAAAERMAAMMGMSGMVPRSSPAALFPFKVLVDNGELSGGPVIHAEDADWTSFFGRARREFAMGPGGVPMPVSAPDLTAGYLQQANGGVLVVETDKLFKNADVYKALMAMVDRGEAEFAEGGIMNVAPRPSDRSAVPLKVKLVFVGPAIHKMLLGQYDPSFASLFKMGAEFEGAMYVGGAQAVEAVTGYVTFMAKTVAKLGLPHFAKSAIQRVLEHGARLADSNEMVSLAFAPIERLMSEAAAYARGKGSSEVQADDVEEALEAAEDSESLSRDKLYNAIADGTLPVDVDGLKRDSFSGIAVIGGGGEHSFGTLSRITVKTYAHPKGEIAISTEDRAQLAGQSFKQSVSNVSAFFRGTLGGVKFLPFEASVKFEQSYAGIDGDSATQAMIYLIGASLADVPLRQNWAATGSADQHGNVQVIGGLNHKIEGAWAIAQEIARRKGWEWTPEHPYHVMIPAANLRNLALKPAVQEAVRAGRLQLVPVVHVSQGFELLTGVPYAELIRRWGERRDDIVAANRPSRSRGAARRTVAKEAGSGPAAG